MPLPICKCGQPIKMANESLCEDCMTNELAMRSLSVGPTQADLGKLYGGDMSPPAGVKPRGLGIEHRIKGKRKPRHQDVDDHDGMGPIGIPFGNK
jgi:hypothetical protein